MIIVDEARPEGILSYFFHNFIKWQWIEGVFPVASFTTVAYKRFIKIAVNIQIDKPWSLPQNLHKCVVAYVIESLVYPSIRSERTGNIKIAQWFVHFLSVLVYPIETQYQQVYR